MIGREWVSRNLSLWHPWFAWRPVRVWAGTSKMYAWVWLEWIERRRKYHYDDYTDEYRLVKK